MKRVPLAGWTPLLGVEYPMDLTESRHFLTGFLICGCVRVGIAGGPTGSSGKGDEEQPPDRRCDALDDDPDFENVDEDCDQGKKGPFRPAGFS